MMGVNGIIVALAPEAAALRDAWGLKSVPAGPFRCYADADRVLAVSGVGRVRCASAVGWLLERYPDIRSGVLINAGIAGSGSREAGSIHIVHQAADMSTGRRYYPDILFAHPYGEAALRTVDTPMDAPGEGVDANDLVDMEGAAFLEAALLWMPCHRVQLIKTVSDNLAPDKVDKARVTRLMEAAVPAVEYVINTVTEGDIAGNMDDRMRVFSRLAEQWRLTATQRAQLNRAGRAWLLRHPDADFIPENDIKAPHDKQTRGRMLSILLDRLWEG